MLFDPSKQNGIPTVEGFIMWAETKDPNDEYYWPSSCNCAVGQYLTAIGVSVSADWTEAKRLNREAVDAINGAAYWVARREKYEGHVVTHTFGTFGALIARLRASL